MPKRGRQSLVFIMKGGAVAPICPLNPPLLAIVNTIASSGGFRGGKSHENEILVSSLVARGDRWNEHVSQVNNILKARCHREGFPFIDNSNIDPAFHLNRSNLHLNSEGTRMLANNFLKALGHY